MTRSLKVSPQYIEKVKSALKRNGYPSQKAFYDELGISKSTAQNFFNGKPVDYQYFVDICEKLGLDWKDISQIDIQDESIVKPERNNSPIPCTAYKEETWIGREEEIRELSQKLRGECRILIITGITGQGKTALAERLASVELGGEWQRLPAVNFDDGVSRDFVGAADVLLTRLGETVTPQERSQPEFLLNRLVQKLRTNRYLVQIDSVEVLLQKGDENPVRNEFEDQRWWEFFKQLLAGGECQSRLILTSQHLPTQFSSRYKNFWQRKSLSGLSETEQLLLFSKLFEQKDPPLPPLTRGENLNQKPPLTRGENLNQKPPLTRGENLNQKPPLTRGGESEFKAPLIKGGWGDLFINGEINPDSEAAGYLLRMGNTYEGHPLLIEVLAGEILEHPYNGNVVAYWRKHQQEFEAIAPARNSEELERNVKDRVRETLKRLEKDSPYAYGLLLRSSVYRLPVTEDFWLAMLQGLTDEEKNSALQTLKYRYLLEEVVTKSDKYLVRQHNLIRNVAYQHLIEISNKGLEWKDDHYIAAQMWLTAYQPEPDASNLEQVRGYLEAFHHYCEIEDWVSAWKTLCIHLNTPTNEKLHTQLGIWGYYQYQVELYSKLLGKISPIFDILFWGNLGNAYNFQEDYNNAISCYQHYLNYAGKIGYQGDDSTTLNNLGTAYLFQKNYAQAMNYYRQTLAATRKIGDKASIGALLGSLGNFCNVVGEYHRAFECYQQCLSIARETNDHNKEGTTLCNLGYTLINLERYSEAKEYLEQSLIICNKIGAYHTKAKALRNLAALHQKLGQHDRALEYCDRALALATELGIPLAKECQKLKEELLTMEKEEQEKRI